MWTLVLYALFTVAVHGAITQKDAMIVYKNATSITIGFSTFINTNNPQDKIHGRSALDAFDLFNRTFYNKTGGVVNVRGVPLNFKFLLLDNKSNATTDLDNHKSFCFDEEVLVIIGSLVSAYCLPASGFLNNVCPDQKLQVHGCALPDPFVTTQSATYAIGSGLNTTLPSFFPYFRIFKATKIALLCSVNPYTQSLCAGAQLNAADGGVTVVYRGNLDNNFNGGNVTNCTRELQHAMDAGAQGLFLMAFESCVGPLIVYSKSMNYHFDLIIIAPERDYSLTGNYKLPVDTSNYLCVIQLGHPDSKYGDGWITNASVFYQTFLSTYNYTPPSFPYYYYTALVALYKALVSLPASSQTSTCAADPDILFTSDELAASFGKLDFTSVVGRIVYDNQHRSLATNILTQVYDGVSHIVAPPDTQYRELYIATPWSDRYYNPAYDSVEIGFMIAIGILILISLGLVVVVIVLRNTSLIRASMPTFLIAMLIGSICIYVGVLIWTVHGLTTAICHVRVWLIALGFVLIYGCMLAKTFRVWYLWSRAVSAQRAVITNVQLTIIILTSVVFFSVLLAIYSGAGDVQVTTEIPDTFRPALNVERCYENDVGKGFLYLIFVIGLVSVISGFFFSFLTRKVSFLAFNESKQILFSVYNILFFGVLAIIILHLKVSATVQYILRSLCILLASFLTIVIVFGTKLWYLSNKKTGASKKHVSTTSATKTGSSRQSSAAGTNDDDKE